jgi:hypothetical protein
VGQIGAITLPCVVQRGCGLSTVDDLEVDESCDPVKTVGTDLDIGMAGSGRDSVVVGEEAFRFSLNRGVDAAVDFVPVLKERPDITLQQTAAVLLIQIGKQLAGYQCHEAPVPVTRLRRGQTGHRGLLAGEVDIDVILAGA